MDNLRSLSLARRTGQAIVLIDEDGRKLATIRVARTAGRCQLITLAPAGIRIVREELLTSDEGSPRVE